MTSETNIVRLVAERASKLGHRLWRQQSGMGWIGKSERFDRPQTVSVKPGDVVIRNARVFHSGFEGISDTGGFVQLTVTPEMVGSSLPVIFQVEVKTPTGSVRDGQRKWISYIRKIGGRAGIARCADDVNRIAEGEILD